MSDVTTTELEEVAHAASDALFDVSALLSAARLAVESEEISTNYVDRVLRQIEARVEQIRRTFDPHI
jgi:hypothetical protein